MTYRAMVLCLNSLYREELAFVASIKHRYPHIDVWLSQTDGRASALAEASRLGADGLLCDDGFQRFAVAEEKPTAAENQPQVSVQVSPNVKAQQAVADAARAVKVFAEAPIGDPVLTADELRALLQEPAKHPPEQ